MNRYQATGYIVGQPELKATTQGTPILSFSLNILDSQKNANGEWEDYANFIDCVMFGKRAESVSKFLSPKRYVAIDGKLRQSRWGKDGYKRSKIECIIDNVYLPPYAQQTSTQAPTQAEIYDEDIPF